MENIRSADVGSRLAEILQRVRAGESFIITDNGEEAAQLVPPPHSAPPTQSNGRRPGAAMTVAEAVATIRNLRPARPLKRDELRSFIDEGRRF